MLLTFPQPFQNKEFNYFSAVQEFWTSKGKKCLMSKAWICSSHKHVNPEHYQDILH